MGLMLMGLMPGFKLPGFMKNPLFWKVAALVAAAFFIWHKANAGANARWQLALHQKTATLKAQAAERLNEQRDQDMKRIFELETLNHELKTEKNTLDKRRRAKKNALSNACTVCRVPRGRSPRRMRR